MRLLPKTQSTKDRPPARLTGCGLRRRLHRRPTSCGLAATAIAGLTVAVAVLDPAPVWAATAALTVPSASTSGIGEVTAFAARLTDYVTAAAASVAVLFIAINGLRWTTSGGNPARQAEARTGLAAALVGLALAVSANLIVNLVLAALK